MGLEFQDISYSYSRDKILKGISLTAKRGEVTCILGPSGCGKTTLLRLAAGLMPVQEGQVVLDGESMASPKSSLPPEKRPVGLVFQEGALFPHLSVGANVAFGLTGNEAEKNETVAAYLKKVGLAGFEGRFPHTLSGGQQQRVALARALAPAPKVLLLDEPFANIDSQLRRDLREETRRTLKESGTVVMLVTHDPEEALEMADHIVVMDQGLVAQAGSPQHLFDQPATIEVAKMFGRGQALSALMVEDHIETPFGNWPLSCLAHAPDQAGPLDIVVRQEAFSLLENSEQASLCKIVDMRTYGQDKLAFIEGADSQVLRVQLSRDQKMDIGAAVSLSPAEKSVFGFRSAE